MNTNRFRPGTRVRPLPYNASNAVFVVAYTMDGWVTCAAIGSVGQLYGTFKFRVTELEVC